LNLFFADPSAEFAAAWSAAEARMAAVDGTPFFLEEAFLARTCHELAIPPDATHALHELRKTLGRQDELRRAVAVLHELDFGTQPLPLGRWPAFAGPLHEHEASVCLLLILAAIPQLQARYDALHIPADVRAATLSDVPLWLNRLRADAGIVGLSRRICQWLHCHLTATIFRLGRLQFQPNGA